MLARRFDETLRPLDLTSGQFSLLMCLNQPRPPNIGTIASILTMDRTTLTAALKPLQRRGLVRTIIDPADKRNRRVALTEAGRALLSRALPAWREAHTRLEKRIGGAADRLRNDLRILAEPLTP